MKNIFQPLGFLDTELPEYEYRSSQMHMAEFIHEKLTHPENGIVEAGTGTGKTMAYLFASLKYALQEGKKVAVSTETKALQKQLLDKDLPIVKKIFRENLSMDFTYSLCLGSSNYPCISRFERSVKKGLFSPEDMKYVKKVSRLFGERQIFTNFDANVPVRIWNEMNRDPDVCTNQRCPSAPQCPFQAARREWAQSDLLIMNHYLFFSNISSGKAFLPVTEAVIFDEAHSIESIASSQLGFSIDEGSLILLLQRFYSGGKRGVINSYFNESQRKEGIKLIDSAARESQIFFEKMRNLFGDRETVKRIKTPMPAGDVLHDILKKFLTLLDSVEQDMEEEDQRMEYEPARNRLAGYADALKSFIKLSKDSFVYWMERSSRELLGNISLIGRPVNINEIMRNEVFSFYESSIFVSATLSVKKDFNFFISRTGFTGGSGIVLESPFDYKKQMILYVGEKLPDPAQPSYPQKAAEEIAEIAELLNGNCLILFTSYYMLREVRSILQDEVDFTIYSQDEMSASKALSSYIEDHNSILMGTHSFWQGIDLPGDLLRGVIITRLPFAVPDTPIMEAKFEKLKKDGKNPFINLQIPEAVIKMKQGAGRLIRNSKDRGIVAILDSRIASKNYGSSFLDSMPGCGRVKNLSDLTVKYKELFDLKDN